MQNKVTKRVKEVLREAFDEVGGIDYFVKMAKEEPRAFMGLLGKLIPNEIHAEIDGDVPLVILRDYTGLTPEQKAMLGQPSALPPGEVRTVDAAPTPEEPVEERSEEPEKEEKMEGFRLLRPWESMRQRVAER